MGKPQDCKLFLTLVYTIVYIVIEVIAVETAKLFTNGQSQAVRLPKEYRFSGDEVGITRLGELVVLCPKGREDALFFSSLGKFTDDFFDSIASARSENYPDTPRDQL